MKLVFIFGPQAVGKMTVGQELSKLTGLKLFHNHMTIELVMNFFDVVDTEEGAYLNRHFRQEIFEAVAKSDLPGLIFTYMFDFDDPSEYEYINSICDLYRKYDADIFFVELCAPLDVRLARNVTENRLLHKPSKRDLKGSEALLYGESQYRLNTDPDEVPYDNYLKINNADMAPDAVAAIIQKTFNL